MSPACRERHPSVMPFACIKRSVETLFFSAMASHKSPSLTTYLPPPHAEELPLEGLLDAAVSAGVEGVVVAEVEGGALSTSFEADPVVPDGVSVALDVVPPE